MATFSQARRARWSAAFREALAKRGLRPDHVARELGVSSSVVHYWTRGSMPRDPELRERVRQWSGGEVSA